MDQLVQVLGSMLILVAFGAAQRGGLSTTSTAYLVLNLVGSGILSLVAAAEQQVGFFLLESCWALVSGWGLLRRSRPAPDAAQSG